MMRSILKFELLAYLALFAFSACDTKVSVKQESPNEDSVIKEKTLIVQHEVISDEHPMAVWEKKVTDPKGIILMVHGRTWSGVPDFDLQVDGEDLSLMDGMNQAGYTTYAVDLRGYGKTPRNKNGWNNPLQAAQDVINVIQWISGQNNSQKVHLFGWSMGSTISLLATQNDPSLIATLSVFGFWLDLDNEIPADPNNMALEKRVNTAEAAASDFIIPGSISQKAIDTYVKMALEADPIRADWKQTSEYNQIDPAKIEIPVLILQGEKDPIGPTEKQLKLFTRLKTGDKSWAVMAGGDHAAFMETPRSHFIKAFSGFIERYN